MCDKYLTTNNWKRDSNAAVSFQEQRTYVHTFSSLISFCSVALKISILKENWGGEAQNKVYGGNTSLCDLKIII